MSSRPLGRLPNAPLAYVLAQVRFQPILEIEKSIPSIQSALRDRYPRFNQVAQTLIEIGPQGPSMQTLAAARWEFGSPTNKQGIILQTNSLVYHVTEYSNYEEFGQEFLIVMKEISAHVPHIFVDRLGLRYIDFIIPAQGKRPEDYVTDRLRCDPNPGIEYLGHTGITMAEYTLSEGKLAVRYARGTGKPGLPQDLATLSLEPSNVMLKEPPTGTETAILDTDRIVDLNMSFDSDTLIKRFDGMHNDLSKAFKTLTTEPALAAWSHNPEQ